MEDPRADAPLWAITAYFNPAGYRRRRDNYRVFRERLQAPLVTAELSCDGNFALSSDDADVLVQVHGDAMWQKERLLNLALGAVPSACQAVA